MPGMMIRLLVPGWFFVWLHLTRLTDESVVSELTGLFGLIHKYFTN